MTSVTKQSGSKSRYDYDELGNLLDKAYSANFEDAATYTYDAEGRVSTRTDKCGTATYEYDGAGRLVAEIDGFGQRLAYAYDDAGRMSRMEYPDGEVVEYAYDDSGQMATVSTSEGAYSYSYDERGLCAGIARPSGIGTEMRYDADGNLTWLRNADASGSTLSEYSYTYDKEGRIASEDSEVEGDDRRAHLFHLEFAYTPAGKLASCSGSEDGRPFSESYSYDAKGNRKSLERAGDGAEHVDYSYDGADRLVLEESSASGTVEYSYDADGRLVRKSGGGRDRSYFYGAEDRLEAVCEGDLLLMSAVYDGDGKRVAESSLYHEPRLLPEGGALAGAAGLLAGLAGGGEQDEERVGRALSAAAYGMAAMTGAYSVMANPAVACEAVPVACRAARELFGVGGSYVPKGLPSLVLSGLEGEEGLARALGQAPGLSVVDERYDVTSFANTTAFGAFQVASSSSTRFGGRDYVYGAGRLARLSSGGAGCYLEDGRGSAVQEADASGAVSSWRTFSAFGEVSAGSDDGEAPFFGYNGEPQSPLTGLVYMRARHYDAASGRFGSPDPLLGDASDPLTLNRYLYCGSDPVNFTDPTGRARLAMDPSARPGRASIGERQRDFCQIETSVSLKKTRQAAWAAAKSNTDKWRKERGARIQSKYGPAAARAFYVATAQRYQRQVEEIYCGSADHLKETAAQLHGFAADFGWIPIVGTLADWCAYVAEGDVGMTVLYSVLSLAEVLTLGGVSKAKAVGRIFVGSGTKIVKSAHKGVDVVDPNRLHHIFDDPKHKLDGFLSAYEGSQEKAFRAIEGEAIKHADAGKTLKDAPFTPVNTIINGYNIELRYQIVDGVVRVTTAYAPKK